VNPDTPYSVLALRQIRSAAEQGHQPLAVFEARTAEQALAGTEMAIKASAAGLLLLDEPVLMSVRPQIIGLVSAARLPTIAGNRAFAEAGGLMTYGPDQRETYRRAAEYVDKILKGARPADLPVEQPTKFEFVINQKTAKALGLTIPPSILARADEVIE
jgi:putative tryptophan/tyrosine transport system substrate-binding protein